MALPKSPTIKIPLNNRDPNENTSTFRRLLESNRTLRSRANVKKRLPSHSKLQKQKQSSRNEPSLPPTSDEQVPSSDTVAPSSLSPIIDLPTHFKQLEQQKKRRKETTASSYSTIPTTTTVHHKSNEPKLQLALSREYSNYRGREIFIDTDTPIFTLPTESMWTIFERCASFEDYHQIACVCKKWRSLINAAPLWKDVAIQWRHLLVVINNQLTIPYYDYITTLSVIGATSKVMVNPMAIGTTNVSFKHLRHMRITNINYTDVKFIVEWMRELESVHCEGISCSTGQSVSLRIFSDMPCLKSLRLNFAQDYNLAPIPYDFDTNGNLLPKKFILPSSLETFSLQGIYDREEHTANVNDVDRQDRWHMLELQLVRKYSMLTPLTHLTSLTLGRISAFTSRVWLVCLKPCASRLEHLTLMNWPGAGKKECGRIPADASERITEGSMEAAIAECFSSLKQVKEIYLDDFVCDIGVIDGLSQLDTNYQIHIEGLQDQQQQYSVSDFKAVKVFGFKISMLRSPRVSGSSVAPCRNTKQRE
ncbi:hypothetical protein MAM1_0001d00073 [Mucor ambiguus]|uniref:F-box domain-containing protein n=1 Tax=Mucor ambiguus TaxID=91626 RepID=A0A0C9LZI1_9FUNG|nr:hypothetical protein MAM1_0001d00073 [Mucor ambiguus]